MKYSAIIVNNKDLWNKNDFEVLELDTNKINNIKDLKKKISENLNNNLDFIILSNGKVLVDNINIDDLGENIKLYIINNRKCTKSVLDNSNRETYNNLLNNFINSFDVSSNQTNVDLSNANIQNFINTFQDLYNLNPNISNSTSVNIEYDNNLNDTSDNIYNINDEINDTSDNIDNINDEINDTSNDNNTLNSNLLFSNLFSSNNVLSQILSNTGISLETLRNDYKDELTQLNNMGFTNESKNIEALKVTNGNVEQTVNVLLSNF
jgi:hypothetical protein